jgi:hypothetical protein
MSRTTALARACTPGRAWLASVILALGSTLALAGGRIGILATTGGWIFVGIHFLLAATLLVGPAAWLRDHAEAQRPVLGALGRVLLAFAACVLPGLVFLLGTMFLESPRWKGGAPAGWVDMAVRPMGVAFSPLVAWALIAFYTGHVLGRAREATWLRCGLLGGALSAGCLTAVMGMTTVASSDLAPWMLVPAGTFVLYGCAWLALARRRADTPWDAGAVLAAAAAAAALGTWTAMGLHDALPDEPPKDDCFIVGAAARGHALVVGRRGTEMRRGRPVPVSRQLAIFRAFERLLRARLPSLHARLRAIYAVVGPACARRVSTPWRADVVTILLLPEEVLARLALLADSWSSASATSLPRLDGEHRSHGEEPELHAAAQAEAARADDPRSAHPDDAGAPHPAQGPED